MFFGIGFWECILIAMVALMVFPPRRLPELGRLLGRSLQAIKRFTNDLKKHEF